MESSQEKSIYKYASIDTAIKIIDSEKVLLNNPDNFNDPFDAMINIDDEEINKSFDLYSNYSLQQELKKMNLNKIRNRNFKKRVLIIQNKINRNDTFKYIKDLNEIFKSLNQSNVDNQIEDIKSNYFFSVNKTKKYIRKHTFITCFSHRNNSILMWSHYGDSHKGVCLEFEYEADILNDVHYTDQKPFFNIYQYTRAIIQSNESNEQKKFGNDDLKNNVFSLFCTKAKDWSYEKEVRSISLIDDDIKNCTNLTGITLENGRYYLNLKVKKIFIGIKAHREKLEQLIKLASEKNIPVVYMKEDEKEYLIVEDKNRNKCKEISNKVKL